MREGLRASIHSCTRSYLARSQEDKIVALAALEKAEREAKTQAAARKAAEKALSVVKEEPNLAEDKAAKERKRLEKALSRAKQEAEEAMRKNDELEAKLATVNQRIVEVETNCRKQVGV